MTMLITTIFAAFIGPMSSRLLGTESLWRLGGKKRAPHAPSLAVLSKARRWMHRCAAALMLGTIVVNVIPFNYKALGSTSLLISALTFIVVLIGLRFLVPSQKDPSRFAHQQRLPLVLITFSGLIVHSLADGAALYSFADQAQITWGPALLLDRIAVGFFVWTLMWEVPLPDDLVAMREVIAWAAVTGLCVATMTGYFLMQYVVQILAEPQFLGVVQSVLVGVIIPLITDQSMQHAEKKHEPVSNV